LGSFVFVKNEHLDNPGIDSGVVEIWHDRS